MRFRPWVWSVLLSSALASSSSLEAAPLHPAYDLQGPGLSLAHAGIGLAGLAAGTRTLTLDVGGPVELALLYWAGRERPCQLDAVRSECSVAAEPYLDQVLRFDGARVTGTVTGTETQPTSNLGAILNIGYMADVTDAVRARGMGRLSFALADGDPLSNLAELDGAGLLVVYADPARPAARVLVSHGLDFGYGEDWTPGETQVTDPFTFLHGAARQPRSGEVVLFVGNATRQRPDRIEITNAANIAALANTLDGSAGGQWDADRIPVEVPGGAISTSLQVFSEPYGRNPDSLLWVMAALRVPLPVPTSCSTAFWGDHPEAWRETGIATSQRVRSTFSQAAGYGDVADATLRNALRFRSSSDLLGAAKELLREATASLLNAVHPALESPRTRTQLINQVNEALRSRNLPAIWELTGQLERENAAGCPLR
ncbi:MAG TPA: hypothetical protein VEL74_16800 [Thermoanaerobaculia bacterium]|nr:hypothetical protein [Thermoanaerobaculia bacterium]